MRVNDRSVLNAQRSVIDGAALVLFDRPADDRNAVAEFKERFEYRRLLCETHRYFEIQIAHLVARERKLREDDSIRSEIDRTSRKLDVPFDVGVKVTEDGSRLREREA
jgi:hypothetical protein